MQSNKKIIMNPPTVFCHLASSLTQSIRSNEAQLIFARDEEIGSLQPTSFHFPSEDLPVFEINMKRFEDEGRTRAGVHTNAERSKREQGAGRRRQTRSQTRRGNEKTRLPRGSANMFTSLMPQWRWLLYQAGKRYCKQEDRWDRYARNHVECLQDVLWKGETGREPGSHHLSQQATCYSMRL